MYFHTLSFISYRMDALKSRSFASHLLINHSMIHHILINVCERLFDELVKVIMISSLRYRALPLSIPSANPSTALVPNRFGIDVPWKAFWRGRIPKRFGTTALNCSQLLSTALSSTGDTSLPAFCAGYCLYMYQKGRR